jgi:phosphoglycerol transferase MdoB-like AlkP superfamily enzyme
MPWSELFTVQSNGRLASFFHYARRDLESRRVLARFSDLGDIPAALFPGAPAVKRNVHLVVLESFVDPRLFEGVGYSRSPLADELKPFLLPTGTGFSHVVSPVYGGGTARACFELLSGLPSLGLVEPVEFNLMRKGRIEAFPAQLARNGYVTMATTAASSEYFNEPRAYASLAMDSVQFLGDPGSGFVPRPGDREIFDGDLFEHNLQRLGERRATAGGRPLLNYILGMYGHYPYNRNYKRRPDLIGDDSGIKDVRRIANQFYYRTQALGRYLAQLKAQDPTAIVLVTADHIPAILTAGIRYRHEKFVNSALLLDAFRPVDIGGRRQYEIPWLIWDLLRGEGEGRRPIAPAAMERLYYTALRQSIDAL